MTSLGCLELWATVTTITLMRTRSLMRSDRGDAADGAEQDTVLQSFGHEQTPTHGWVSQCVAHSWDASELSKEAAIGFALPTELAAVDVAETHMSLRVTPQCGAPRLREGFCLDLTAHRWRVRGPLPELANHEERARLQRGTPRDSALRARTFAHSCTSLRRKDESQQRLHVDARSRWESTFGHRSWSASWDTQCARTLVIGCHCW